MSYKTKAEIKDEILELLVDAEEPMTGSAISKEIGYSKLVSRVADALAELVSDGELTTGTKGSHTVYSIDDGEEEEEEACQEELVEVTDVTLDENDFGYTVEALPKDHVRVTFPPDVNGDVKGVDLEPGERLLVISDKYRYVVSAPEHILEAIHQYTMDQGITTYLVTDMSTGKKVPDVSQINMKVAIIFIQISRHNKAGL
jgi:hypothetical protein